MDKDVKLEVDRINFELLWENFQTLATNVPFKSFDLRYFENWLNKHTMLAIPTRYVVEHAKHILEIWESLGLINKISEGWPDSWEIMKQDNDN